MLQSWVNLTIVVLVSSDVRGGSMFYLIWEGKPVALIHRTYIKKKKNLFNEFVIFQDAVISFKKSQVILFTLKLFTNYKYPVIHHSL